ncbi:MAG: anthranilate synthase component I [Candidatus Latescibacterota bacterium]|nr:MAG: anthranilate synthase component I [Candidatus Latescibacterota bacterium]
MSTVRPDFEEFQRLAESGTFVPVARSVLGDTETPVSAYLKLRRGGRRAFLLESVEGGRHIARYSFLGVGPFLTFRSQGKRVVVEGPEGVEEVEGDPFDVLRCLLRKHRAVRLTGLPRFVGGAVGFMSYDAVRLWERLPDGREPVCDDMFWMFFDRILAFDNVRRELVIVALARSDLPAREAYQEALERTAEWERLLLRPVDPLPSPGRRSFSPESNMSRKQFSEMVRRAREYIYAGDVIQVVLSQRFSGEVSVGGLDVYRRLRLVNPSPYMFHLDAGDMELAGASPEMLVRVEGSRVETRPIAGTRPRGRTEEEDRRLERELLADEKERAEHLMLVDLGRNDIGRVSEFGSVHVPAFMEVERYSHVMHLVSSVRGKLREDSDAIEALKACFPAGTVSGAPKVRAMEIIDELEPERRGIYAGAVGYLDFSGNMDTCIAIRTVVIRDHIAQIQAGAGIVADSLPEREYEETLNKAKALIRAVEMAEESG